MIFFAEDELLTRIFFRREKEPATGEERGAVVVLLNPGFRFGENLPRILLPGIDHESSTPAKQ